jgi:hypothetical protein
VRGRETPNLVVVGQLQPEELVPIEVQVQTRAGIGELFLNLEGQQRSLPYQGIENQQSRRTRGVVQAPVGSLAAVVPNPSIPNVLEGEV